MSRVPISQNGHLSGNDHKPLMVIADDHTHLVDLLNALKIAVNSMPINHLKVGEDLEIISTATAQHFSNEEELMLDAGYIGFADHREKHKQILELIKNLVERHHAGEPKVEIDACLEIEQSMLLHLVTADNALLLFLSTKI